jgi:hypothetical protein
MSIRNFTDKALWLTGNVQVNNINVTQLGQISTVAPGPINYGGQDDWGKRVEISNDSIATYTNTTNGTLFGALYQLVQVDSGATAANVKTGTMAFLKDQAAGNGVPVVTSEDVQTGGQVAGIFLNSITPGNYGAICVAGKVNALFASSLTAGQNAGDIVGFGKGSGALDDIAVATGGWTGKSIGTAIAAPATSTISTIRLRLCYQV